MFGFIQVSKFIDDLIDGLIRFVYALMAAWLRVALRPFRGSLALATSPKAPNSQTVLFAACLLMAAVSGMEPANLGELALGQEPTIVGHEIDEPRVAWQARAGGLPGLLISAIGSYIFIDLVTRGLALLAHDVGQRHSRHSPRWRRWRRAAAMLRFAFAAGLVLGLPVGLALAPLADLLMETSAMRRWAMGPAFNLTLAATLYPAAVASAALLRSNATKPRLRSWPVLAAAAVVGVALYSAASTLVTLALLDLRDRIFVEPAAPVEVVALSCRFAPSGVKFEAALRNAGARPAILAPGDMSLSIFELVAADPRRRMSAEPREVDTLLLASAPLVVIDPGDAAVITGVSRRGFGVGQADYWRHGCALQGSRATRVRLVGRYWQFDDPITPDR